MNILEIKSDGTNAGTIITIDGVEQKGIQKFTFKVHELMPWASIELVTSDHENMMAKPLTHTNDPIGLAKFTTTDGKMAV